MRPDVIGGRQTTNGCNNLPTRYSHDLNWASISFDCLFTIATRYFDISGAGNEGTAGRRYTTTIVARCANSEYRNVGKSFNKVSDKYTRDDY